MKTFKELLEGTKSKKERYLRKVSRRWEKFSGDAVARGTTPLHNMPPKGKNLEKQLIGQRLDRAMRAAGERLVPKQDIPFGLNWMREMGVSYGGMHPRMTEFNRAAEASRTFNLGKKWGEARNRLDFDLQRITKANNEGNRKLRRLFQTRILPQSFSTFHKLTRTYGLPPEENPPDNPLQGT